jgi:hypothetical protein
METSAPAGRYVGSLSSPRGLEQRDIDAAFLCAAVNFVRSLIAKQKEAEK